MGRFNNLINAFGNLDKIYEGIKNKVFVKEDVEQIASIRWDICTNCDLFDTTGAYCAVPGTQPCCADCGCILNLKVRSLSSECPIGKWSKFMTEDQEENLKNNLE